VAGAMIGAKFSSSVCHQKSYFPTVGMTGIDVKAFLENRGRSVLL
jgi:hypothetical protein